MGKHNTIIKVDGKEFKTLADILPDAGSLKILFIAKTPAQISVDAGHYFQGRQGTMFWNKLLEYNILKVPYNHYPDDHLLENGYGITDIVKKPRDYGDEPSDEEYKIGLIQILKIIDTHSPKVIFFIYKGVLDNILRLKFGIKTKSNYGFNPQYDRLFNSRVFVFPMPGTPCTTELSKNSMNELKEYLQLN